MFMQELPVAVQEYLETLGLFKVFCDREGSPACTAAVLHCYRCYPILGYVVERMGGLYGQPPMCDVLPVDVDEWVKHERTRTSFSITCG